MPKRTDLKKILIVGAGPIVIGQACEFDYSGTQACKSLKEEGYEVVLVNSNPATIMTDPNFADRTYIEPITPEYVTQIIEKEKPDALLPTMGGQTSLNIAVALAKDGTLKEHNVELIGAKLDAIELAEDRAKFKKLVEGLGLNTPQSGIANSMPEGKKIAAEIGLPLILRPAYTLGGSGGGIAYTQEEFEEILNKGLIASPTSQVLIEQSVIGWKEFEMEVMRDFSDNVVIICSIENIDPMGVHTGDSITVAPVQTLTDKEYQEMRDASKKIIRGVGIETGGCNIQFAQNPENGEYIVIEMNPRVSRSSALASKATGFPIAKIAAKLAVGYTLDEIPNDITQKTMASFEPSIDYVVTKIPRFAFEKFPGADSTLNTQMKSVGETMAIGRSFKESFQKALRGLETGALGFINHKEIDPEAKPIEKIRKPKFDRVFDVYNALYKGHDIEQVFEATKIDRWFLSHFSGIVENQRKLESLDIQGKKDLKKLNKEFLHELKSQGFGDKQIAHILKLEEKDIREYRLKNKIKAVYKTIDTCAGEFESFTPYHYSSYDEEDEVQKSNKEKIIIIGGGPNRIGQGIEFDYCCVHAAQSLKELGYESIMVNNNPETVSTDYDTSSRLYFEPITTEDVLAIWEREKSNGGKLLGVIVQLGGQTPLNIAKELEDNGVKILGTNPESIDIAEDRELFGKILDKAKLKQTPNAIAFDMETAIEAANKIGYPVLLRPSYVLGGRGMERVYNDQELGTWMSEIILNESGNIQGKTKNPVLIDKFLERATEIDVDVISDGKDSFVAGIMEHIEHAGIHSGDSACVLPSQTLSHNSIAEIKEASIKLAKALKVKGLMNIQFAIKDEELYILEANPRASRTVPFVSKATGVSWAKVASLIMAGKSLKSQGIDQEPNAKHISVKEAVFSFNKFIDSSIQLGPEMKSTGEVMGISHKFANAFAKAQIGASFEIPHEGTIFVSVNDDDKAFIGPIALALKKLKYNIISTAGTAQLLNSMGVEAENLNKLSAGTGNAVEKIKNGDIQLIINVPSGREAMDDHTLIGQTALAHQVPIITTITGAEATVKALQALKASKTTVKALQDHYLDN